MEVHRWNLEATMRPKVVAAIDEQQPGQESPLIRRWSRKSFPATCDRVANWRGQDHTSVPRPQHSGVIDLRGGGVHCSAVKLLGGWACRHDCWRHCVAMFARGRQAAWRPGHT